MRSILLSFILLLGVSALNPADANASNEKAAEAALNNVDAIQAMALANQWKWSKEKIKTYVNSREVVFTFPSGRVKKVPLPKEKMIVAVAPFIRRTHS